MTETTPAKKREPRSQPHLERAARLQQRVAGGQASPREAREYRRVITELRRKFINGQLSPDSARRFGIE